MALIRKTFGAGFEQMKLVVKVCDENLQLRQNLKRLGHSVDNHIEDLLH